MGRIMTVRELLTKERDYVKLKIIKDGETLFFDDINSLRDMDKELLNLKVLRYEFDIKIWLSGYKGGYYQILVIEVK
jgi:hypothetical protein